MQFQFEQFIGLPRAALFAFHENPEHLALLHQEWSTFRMIRHDGSIAVKNKLWVETTILRIVPIVLGFEHMLYEPPHRFGERLIHGPFKRFIHIHEFIEAEAGTLVRDHLEVELPWCYGGEAAMKTLVAPLLRNAFRQRGKALLKLAQSGVVVDPTRQSLS